jgi:hypothetical protein
MIASKNKYKDPINGFTRPFQIRRWGGVKKDNTRSTVTYYHVELEEHSVVIADGVLTESYLDVGNRGEFKEFKK